MLPTMQFIICLDTTFMITIYFQRFKSGMLAPSKWTENGACHQRFVCLIWSIGFTHSEFRRHCQIRGETVLRNLHSRRHSAGSADQYFGLLLVLLLHFELLAPFNGRFYLKSDFSREMIDTLTHCFSSRFPSHL